MLDQENICLSVEKKQRDYKSVAPEIVQTSSFQFDDFQHYVDVNMNKKSAYTYTRGENPTLTILEEKLAQLEKGECAKVFASGMGAISATILSLVQQKDHIVIVNTVYGSTVKFIQNLERFGVESTKIDVSSTEDIFAFVKDNTRMIYFESPSSQKFEMLDLEMISQFAKKRNIITVIDNTWATPLFQNPLVHGIDIVIHSCSKYIGGHSDLVGGVVISNQKYIHEINESGQIFLGATMSPMNAWLALRGLRTLPVRLKSQEQSVKQMIQFLQQSPYVKKIYHPMVHTSTDLTDKYLKGYGSLLSFVLKDATPDVIERFVDSLKHFTLAYSWGGFESLVMPVWKGSNEEELKKRGLDIGHIRMYIGLEEVELLIEDLQNAFNHAYK